MKQNILVLAVLQLLINFSQIHPVESNKILVLMMMGTKSHRIAFDPLFHELGSRGHQLTILSHSPDANRHENITEIQGLTVAQILKIGINPYEDRLNNKMMDAFKMGSVVALVCQQFHTMPEVQKLLNDKFDLIIIDGIANECSFGLASQFKKTPYILINSMPPATHVTSIRGIPNNPAIRPMTFSTVSFKNRMNYWERAVSLLDYINFEFRMKDRYFYDLENGYRRDFPDAPSIPDFLRNVSLMLSNTHVSIDYPLAQSDLIEVGGIHCRPAKPLPKNLDKFLSSSGKDGFIFFSMGSATPGSQMPVHIRNIFLSVFSKLKQKVLWKFETDDLKDLPKNVKLTKWVSQQDVLGHKNIRLFITHTGFLSYQESAYHGVPILGIPMFADQFVNIQLAIERGFGLEQDFREMTDESLTSQIERMLTEPSFAKNAKMLSETFRNRPADPLKTAVFWVEFIMKFGSTSNDFLRPYASHLNFFQYYSLDIILPAIGIIVVNTYLDIIFIKWVIAKISGTKVKEIKLD